MREVEKFSFKKLLLTIFKCILLTCFVGNVILFVEGVECYLIGEQMGNTFTSDSYEESENLWKMSEDAYSEFKDGAENLRDKYTDHYGEQYRDEIPAEGILLNRMIFELGMEGRIKVFMLSILYGTILGTAVYIISVQNAKGKKLVKEIAIATLVISLIVVITNYIVKIVVFRDIIGNSEYMEYNLYSNDDSIIVIGTIILVAVYLVNMIKQKYLARKLNKELHNN